MIITNKHKLPKQFVSFAEKQLNETLHLDDKTYRVTSLLKGYKEAILLNRYRNDIVIDVSNLGWMLFGTAVHSVLRKNNEDEREIKEFRVAKSFNIAGEEISLIGHVDLYNEITNTLTDHKTCSVWKYIYRTYEEWSEQLATYGMLLKDIGILVEEGRCIAVFRDFNINKAKQSLNYPQQSMLEISFVFNDEIFEQQEEIIIKKLTKIREYEKLADDDIPECTPEERWNYPTYAIIKKGNKTATRVFDKKIEAEMYYETMKKNTEYEIVKRDGKNKKCEYCFPKHFCNFYKNNVEEIKNE